MKQSVIQSIMKRVSEQIALHEIHVNYFKEEAKVCYAVGYFKVATENRKRRLYWEKQRDKFVFIQKELKAELNAQKKPKASKKHGKIVA